MRRSDVSTISRVDIVACRVRAPCVAWPSRSAHPLFDPCTRRRIRSKMPRIRDADFGGRPDRESTPLRTNSIWRACEASRAGICVRKFVIRLPKFDGSAWCVHPGISGSASFALTCATYHAFPVSAPVRLPGGARTPRRGEARQAAPSRMGRRSGQRAILPTAAAQGRFCLVYDAR